VAGVKAIILTAFLLQAAPLGAYPLVDAQCKDDPKACVVAGKLGFVSIYGEIGKEDLAFFKMLDETLPPGTTFPRIVLNSFGGTTSAALEIGRILRRHEAIAETGSPVIPDSAPQCSSACALVALGAAQRRLSHVGIHGPYMRQKVGANVWVSVPADRSEINAYLVEMDASRELIEVFKNTDFDTISDYFYDPSENLEAQEVFWLGVYSTNNEIFAEQVDLALETNRFKDNSDYLTNAAFYGSIQAMRDLARDKLTYVPDLPPDYEGANIWLEMAAEQGDAASLHNLGYHYSYGLGAPKDEAKGVSFYRAAAKLGFAPAQNNLGWAYHTGVGVPRSLTDAVYWITRAANQGEPFAYGSLCEIGGETDLFRGDPTEAFMWCGLAVHNMPEGSAKDAAWIVYNRIMKTITPADFAAGSLALKKWEDEVVTVSQMRDVGDDLN